MSLPDELRQRRAALRREEQNQLRQGRAEMMMLRRLMGQKIADIAEAFNVSKAVVRNELAWGRSQGALERAGQIIREQLIPKAVAAYDMQLESGNLDAARDILFGTGVLRKSFDVTARTAPGPTETFEQWRITRVTRGGNGQVPSAGPDVVVEALPAAPAALTGVAEGELEGDQHPTTETAALIESPPEEMSDVPQQ